MSLNWEARKEAWDGRAAALGRRAVLHVGHKTVEQQLAIYELQRTTILPLFETAIKDKGIKHTLDFGCGVGRWTHDLAAITNGYVIGVDPTQQFLNVCETERLSPFVSYRLYEHGRIPVKDESQDAVYACMVLSTVLEEDMFQHTLSELRRVLAVGGLMFLVDNTAGPPHRPVVRSPFSISRTIPEYTAAFKPWVDLLPYGGYEDLGEINTVFWGYKR